MKIAVTGASGFIGNALTQFLRENGMTPYPIVRRQPEDGLEIQWDPVTGEIEAEKLEGMDAVIHLAGENIADGRWSQEKKRRIHASRVEGTALLAETLAHLATPPPVLLSASAIGFYGDCGDARVDEGSPQGEGFLAQVCHDWEDAATPAAEVGIRVVHPRIGFVVSTEGGGLAKMLTPFKLGLGGRLGTGEQFMSWIALEDLLRGLLFCMETPSLSGAVNLVAPEPVTNQEFTATLGGALNRPHVATMPAFAARLVFGEMADEMLLSSCRVAPKKLQEAGFTFLHPEIAPFLKQLLS